MKSKQNKTINAKRSPIAGKKINYDNSNKIYEKGTNNRDTTHHNEFQLVYKIKNSGTSNDNYQEESFESVIMLKSKNKIKRFSNKTKRQQQKQKVRPKSPNHDLKSMIKRIERKIEDHEILQHKRLEKYLSLQKKKKPEKAQNKNITNRVKKQTKIISNTVKNKEMKRVKSIQNIQRKQQNSATKLNLKLSKQKMNALQIRNNKSPRKQESKGKRVIQLNTSKRKRNSENYQYLIHMKQQQKPIKKTEQKQEEYILFENQILESDININNQLDNIMLVNNNFKQGSHPTEIKLVDNQDDDDDQEIATIRKYYDQKATTIQRIWRGYMVRKNMKHLLKKPKTKIQKQPQAILKEVDTKLYSLNSLEEQFQNETDQMQSIEIKNKKIEQQPSISEKITQMIREIQNISNKNQKQKLVEQFKILFEGSKPIQSEQSNDDVNQTLNVRQNAIELRLNTQTSILKKLLRDNKINQLQYERKIIEAQKWAYTEKEQINKLKKLLKQNLVRAAEIVKKTHEDLIIVEKVKSGEEEETALNKIIENLNTNENSESGQYFFYPQKFPSKDQKQVQDRPKSTGCHISSAQQKRLNLYLKKDADEKQQEIVPQINQFQGTNLKQFIEQFKQRQKVKNQIEKRIAMQMSYIKYLPKENTINTSMQAMHTFLTNFFRFITYYYKEEFLRYINMPFGYSPEKRMKFLQGYDNSTDQQQDNVEGVENVIGLQMFVQFQQHFYEDKEQIQGKTVFYESIHNRAVFDAFNEALNLFRPYFSINGPPYLWNTSEKALTFYFIAEDNIQQVFQKTKYKVMKCTSSLCGILVNQYDNNEKQKKQSATTFEDIIQAKSTGHPMIIECREDRLNKSEKQFITETDFQWYLYQEQRTDTMFQLSNLIFERLVREFCFQLNII